MAPETAAASAMISGNVSQYLKLVDKHYDEQSYSINDVCGLCCLPQSIYDRQSFRICRQCMTCHPQRVCTAAAASHLRLPDEATTVPANPSEQIMCFPRRFAIHALDRFESCSKRTTVPREYHRLLQTCLPRLTRLPRKC